jgi:hypothetical protein
MVQARLHVSDEKFWHEKHEIIPLHMQSGDSGKRTYVIMHPYSPNSPPPPTPLHMFFRHQRHQLPRLHLTARTWRQRRQGQHKIKIVIRSNTIEPLKIATQATMYDNILLVRTLETTDRLHPATTVAHPIPWFPVIDMQRIETERTTIL